MSTNTSGSGTVTHNHVTCNNSPAHTQVNRPPEASSLYASGTRRKKCTVLTLKAMKRRQDPIVMVTAYDYPSAIAAQNAGIDVILVGDSLGMVVLGYNTTLPVTMEDMLHHCKAVARGAELPLLVGDMPFMSYQASVSEAVRNAGRFLQEAGMDAVKLEGGKTRIKTVQAIVEAGIPVMGHIGLTPQSVNVLGGFKTQGKSAESAARLVEEAVMLQEAGCFALVLESVPEQPARLITETLEIPTIGIGAGPHCDGQVLVFHDALGYFDKFTPRFAKRYASLHTEIQKGLLMFVEEVKNRRFPAPEHYTTMEHEQWQALQDSLS